MIQRILNSKNFLAFALASATQRRPTRLRRDSHGRDGYRDECSCLTHLIVREKRF